MQGNQPLQGVKQETLLFEIQHRLESGVGPVLQPSEAVTLLDWAVWCDDLEKQAELLRLFRQLGGLEMVRAALSDFE
ncbi:MAG: hypothetical protein AB8B82_01085 [Roseovarius sp.]